LKPPSQGAEKRPRNFVKENKAEQQPMRKSAPKSVDEKQHKSYGKVPAYLIKAKEQKEE
jgi:hypothetical protein